MALIQEHVRNDHASLLASSSENKNVSQSKDDGDTAYQLGIAHKVNKLKEKRQSSRKRNSRFGKTDTRGKGSQQLSKAGNENQTQEPVEET